MNKWINEWIKTRWATPKSRGHILKWGVWPTQSSSPGVPSEKILAKTQHHEPGTVESTLHIVTHLILTTFPSLPRSYLPLYAVLAIFLSLLYPSSVNIVPVGSRAANIDQPEQQKKMVGEWSCRWLVSHLKAYTGDCISFIVLPTDISPI